MMKIIFASEPENSSEGSSRLRETDRRCSTMSPPVIFSRVRGVLDQSFVDTIPNHVNKAEFLERMCKDYKVTLDRSESDDMFSLEGQWNDIVNVEECLRKHFVDCFLVQPPKQNIINDNIVATCISSKPKVMSKPISICLEKCTDLESLAHLQSTSQVLSTENKELTSPVVVSVVEDSISLEVGSEVESTSQVILSENEKSQEICLEGIVSEDVQSIELINNDAICENGDQIILDDLCMNKSTTDHENEIYMDIQLSCRPHNGLFEESGNSSVSVVMGTEKSLMEAVCLESSNNDGLTFQHIVESNNLGKECSTSDDWKKIRSRKYEEKAVFKYFCTQCSFKSKRQSHLKKHALLHERVCKLYSCDHCDFSTIRLGHLQRHVLQHSESQLTCSTCNYKTHSKSLLQKHQNLKHKTKKALPVEEKPMLQCTKCYYSTTKEKLFQRHQSVHLSDKSLKKGKKKCFECTKCSFKATMKSNLARHIRNVHMDDRPFLCNICGQGFKRSDTLTQHLVVHAGSDSRMNELQCPHCQKYYRSKALLHEHILVHGDTRSYLCEICGAAFKTRAVQRKHVRCVHGNSKLFPCNHCSKKFNSQYAVKRHMKLHETKTASEAASSETVVKSVEPNTEPVDQWESSVMTLPMHEDVQVLVVQQDDAEQGVIFNEGAIFVQGSTEVQMECTSDSSKTVNVPVLPGQFVFPENMTSEVCTTTGLGDQFSLQDGEIITLQFVQ